MRRLIVAAILVLLCPVAAVAQDAAKPAPPAIRRWLDVQHLHLSSRFRWIESNEGQITSSTHQWQPQVRARILLDSRARYTVHIGAFGGSTFVSGWNNTGGGLGTYTGNFNVKQLFVAAEPVRGLELQVGGLYLMRGENTEITSYDNDAYIVGQRLALRRQRGVLAHVAATVGHIGDFRTPDVFRRIDAIADINYGQFLVAMRVSPLVNISTDYTYEDGRDILREGANVRVDGALRPLSSLRLDAYQRLGDAAGNGFNVAADLQLTPVFAVTAGVAHVDRGYLVPGFTSPNADRFERGTRFYSQGTYSLTRDLSVGWFQSEAFGVDYLIPNERRWELLVTINPTATLKAHGIF